MSYCRWTKDSDVYVFQSVYGHIECCGCSLQPLSSYEAITPIEMHRHLCEHLSVGHKVPQYALNRLREEILESLKKQEKI